MGSRTYLQGVPWHEQRAKKSCNDGSKYCIYNRNICTYTTSKFYHKKCVGKGNCIDFEAKTGTPKVYDKAVVPYENIKITKEEKSMSSDNSDSKSNEAKENNFKRVSKTRIDKIIESINSLENLANTANYSYTDQQVTKMYDYIENYLKESRRRFYQTKNGFQWDD